ncbi:MAG TPA: hypothetical protein DC042_05715 [Bacteroidales bacterium]|nr:hypothetical protein [Bacteroidales bacterium]
MKRNRLLKILLGLAALLLLINVLTTVLAGPWAGKKIISLLNEKSLIWTFELRNAKVYLIPTRITLTGISMKPRMETEGNRYLNGEIGSVKIMGINLWKALFKKEIDIRELSITGSRVSGKLPESKVSKKPLILPVNLRIGRLVVDRLDLAVESESSRQALMIKDAGLKVLDLQGDKLDTVSPAIIKKFEFIANEIITVPPDSLYTNTVGRIDYSSEDGTLTVDRLSIHPNYSDEAFTKRHEFQSDRFDAACMNITLRDFDAPAFLAIRTLACSRIEIKKLDLDVFRDKRKPFNHKVRPVFQDMIRNYKGVLDIDSILLDEGNITYREHAEASNNQGSISFNELHAGIYKITNNPALKSENPVFQLKGEARLMGKGKMTILLKAGLFDPSRTFHLSGSLAAMDADALNPMLENSALIHVNSGRIDAMNFSLSANNTKSSGRMTLLYHGLEIAMINRKTDETTAFKERFMSFFANRKLLDSNPLPKDEVREGPIDFDRDPERFLFHYAFKSILSGMKGSLVKESRNTKNQ